MKNESNDTSTASKSPGRLSLQGEKLLNGFHAARPSFRVPPLPRIRNKTVMTKLNAPNKNAEDSQGNGATATPKNSKQKKGLHLKVNPKDAVLKERGRIEVIKGLIDSKDYNGALKNLMSDTDADFHYFNRVKNSMMGEQHAKAFLRSHGQRRENNTSYKKPGTMDEEEAPRICYWVGINDRGNPLRCHNKCLDHPHERISNNLGVELSKPLDLCVYHVRYCVNTPNHVDKPMKICVPNELALCNECYALRNGHAPKLLARIPGTKRKRWP